MEHAAGMLKEAKLQYCEVLSWLLSGALVFPVPQRYSSTNLGPQARCLITRGPGLPPAYIDEVLALALASSMLGAVPGHEWPEVSGSLQNRPFCIAA